MSPSSDQPAAAAARAAAAAAAAVLVLAAVVTPAWANPHAGPVKSLYTGVASLDGAVVVEGTGGGAKARIDATVLFGKDSAVLRPGARERIRQVAQELTRCGPGRVLVVGHTDDLGPADHGLRLSIRRAAAVADTLGDLLPGGYPITATGKGEQDPAVPNTSEANRRKNRRVVITLDRPGQGCSNGQAAGTSETKPAPTAAPTSQPTRAATPTASAPPTTTAPPPPRTPTSAPTGPTRTAAPTTATPREDGPPTSPDTAAPPAPADPDPGRGSSAWDPVLVSNLFLAAILIAVAALALYRRFRHLDDPGPTPADRPDNPPTPPGDATAAESQETTNPGNSEVERGDGPRHGLTTTQSPARPPGTDGADRSQRPGRSPVDLAFPTDVAYEVTARHSGHRPGVTHGKDLDGDLRIWFSPTCDLPRLSLLGPVTVRAHGAPIARRRPFYTELLAFLALRPHGATPDQVSNAFSLTPARVRNDMKVLRDWLGTNPRTGRRHLPDARDTSAGRARGMAVYQVEGLLVDLHLFERLLHRAGTARPESLPDLDQALRLVQGQPFDQLRPHGWEWLYEGDRIELHTEAAIQRAWETADGLRSRPGGTPSAQPASPFARPDPAQSGHPASANGGRP